MMLDEDLKDIVDEIVLWRKKYNSKCHEIKELNSLVDVLKNDLRISNDSEKRVESKLSQKQELIEQLQELMNNFTEERQKNAKLNEEKQSLHEEIKRLTEQNREDKQVFENEKLYITENYEKKLKQIKDDGSNEVGNLKYKLAMLEEEKAITIDWLHKEVNRKEEEFKHSISQTVSNYEEELSKLNGDLAKAQNEIKMLRERCAASVSMYRNFNSTATDRQIEIGTYRRGDENVIDKGNRYGHTIIRSEPRPMLTGPSQLCPPQEQHSSEFQPKSQQLHDHDTSNVESVVPSRKQKLPITRKRKLYTHVDDIL